MPGAGEVLGDQVDQVDVGLRFGPGDDRRQVLHLIGGRDRVVGLEVDRCRADAPTGLRGSSDSPTNSGSNPTTLWPRASNAFARAVGCARSRRRAPPFRRDAARIVEPFRTDARARA